MTNSNPSAKNKKLILLGSVFVFFLIILSLLLFSKKPPVTTQTTPPVPQTYNQPVGQSGSGETTVSASPQVAFASWTGFQPPQNLPTSLSTYQLKQSYTLDEVTMLAQKLQAGDSVKKDNDIVTAYTVTQVNGNPTVSFLIFNSLSGEYSYRSNVGVALTGAGNTESKLYAFLQNIGWYDPTIKVTATYKDQKKPGVMYYELHREWTPAGAAILNPVGLFNIPENQRLASLTLNTTLANTPEDANIYATSDNKDGYSRLMDFNTITVAVDEKAQRVNMVKSNVRAVQGQSNPTALISYNDAVARLKTGQYSFIMTAPSGAGSGINWEQVYPNNLAAAREAVVTDSVIAYLEQPPSMAQTTLDAHYVFRGYAPLDSGFRVSFIAAVPATASNVQGAKASPFAFLNSLVKDVMAQDDSNSQKQGTFDFSTQQTQPVVQQTKNRTIVNNSICQPSAAELNPVYQSSGLNFGWAPYTWWQGEYRDASDGYWYYIPETGTTASVVESNLDSIIAALVQIAAEGVNDVRSTRRKIIYDINQNVPAQLQQDQAGVPTPTFTLYRNPQADTGQKQGTFDVPTESYEPPAPVTIIAATIQNHTGACPIRLPGGSPTLFLYGAAGSEYTVTPVESLTYADPLRSEGVWNVQVNGTNDLTINGSQRPYIYYEYEKVPFTRPVAGWNINREDIGPWANVIGKELGLTSIEATRVAFEVNHAASKVEGENLFIGLVNQNELENAVPLAVSPTPARSYRLHFYVGNSQGTVQAPTLSPIERTESLLVEFGSYSK